MTNAAVAGVAAAVVGFALAYWAVTRSALASRSIRARLLLGFVLMTALPVLAISVWTAVQGYVNARRQALERLETVASRKEAEIRSWTQAAQNEVSQSLNDAYTLDSARVAFILDRQQLFLVYHYKATRVRLQTYVQQSQYLQQLRLVDTDGQLVLSTDADDGELSEAEREFFTAGGEGVRLELVVAPGGTSPSLLAAMPISDRDGQPLGVLAARAGGDALVQILDEQTGLGTTGKAYLVSPSRALVAGSGPQPPDLPVAPDAPLVVISRGVDTVLQDRANGNAFYTDQRGRQVAGVYRWLGDLDVALLVEQDLSEALQAIYTALAVNAGIAVGSVLVAIAASLVITRSIARPLVNLAGTASRIAGGNLAESAPEGRTDEIGALARAFNSMTAQLRELIGGLEERVAERTKALQRRALQQDTSARVAREITSILDIDDLLARVADLIRNAFQYYHVNVFLLDAGTGALVLRASSGISHPEWRRLLAGDGCLNQGAVAAKTALIANDTATDPRYRPDESLSLTRSELVVPLRVGDEIVGTLDVHSSELDAFSSEDAVVIERLGDQIAIAIQNAHLYQHSRELAVLEERNRLARELHDSVTQSLYSIALFAEAGAKMARSGDAEQLVRQFADVGDSAQQALREMRLQLYELRPLALAEEGLAVALQRRLDTVERRSGIAARLDAPKGLALPSPVEDALYRIAQEALNNVLKHSGASSVWIVLRLAGAQVEMSIRDNGRGFEPAEAAITGGMGLATMKERAQARGGTVIIDTGPGRGTTVVVSVPANGACTSPLGL